MGDIIYRIIFSFFFCVGFFLGIKYMGPFIVFLITSLLNLINGSIYGVFGLIGIFINILLIIIYFCRKEG